MCMNNYRRVVQEKHESYKLHHWKAKKEKKTHLHGCFFLYCFIISTFFLHTTSHTSIMDFGSKYVYKYSHSSDESISDDEDDIPKGDVPTFALPVARR